MQTQISRPDQLTALAQCLVEMLPADRRAAAVVALHGELGAGKTTFTRALARVLGIEEEVRSPTFLLLKQLPLPAPVAGIEQLIHIDAYRIDDPAELETLSFGALRTDPANLIVIEWAERVAEILPAEAIHIAFDIVQHDTRNITITHGQE